jgi:basic membrane protein A
VSQSPPSPASTETRPRARRPSWAAMGAVTTVTLALVASACGSSTKSSSGATTTVAASGGATTTAAGSTGTTTTVGGATTTAPGKVGSGGSSGSGTYKACMVTDTGGIDDRSFNASAWQGMQEAASANSNVTVKYLQSTSSADYTANINEFLSEKCGIIVTVGFDMADATQAAAKAHPTQDFAIVDNEYSPAVSNIDALLYQTDQDAFLGGYLAAAYSKSGTVGTFGGEDIPTVTIYMSGFVAGVRYYNQKNGKHVQVLGWTPETNKGLFTGSFTDQNAGKTDAQTLMQQGADVIFPVAGSVGLGSAQAVEQAGNGSVMEWVDTDGCVSAPQYCNIFLTSVTKGIAPSVKAAVLAAQAGTFKGGNSIGTLANGQVGLSPLHDFSSKVPQSVQTELQTLKQGIISGSISVDPKKYPAS